MRIGYARVSTREQNFDMQVDALREARCEKIYTEAVSGARAERPELNELLRNIRSGDVLVIWKLDRLGRSLKHLVELVETLIKKDVGLQSLHDAVDTTTAQGRFSFNVFASLAEFERDVIRERTYAGLAAARARGRNRGRPKGILPQAEATAMAAETLYREGQLSTRQIASKLSISKSTLYAYHIGGGPVSRQVIDDVLAKDINDMEPTLIRNGYGTKALADLLNIGTGEVRRLVRGQLAPGRTLDLQAQMLKAGLPL